MISGPSAAILADSSRSGGISQLNCGRDSQGRRAELGHDFELRGGLLIAGRRSVPGLPCLFLAPFEVSAYVCVYRGGAEDRIDGAEDRNELRARMDEIELGLLPGSSCTMNR